MIIKRLATGIKSQDWFVVIVEVMIVVVGIFIGLQADDWNKAREEILLEQQYIERLHGDVVQSIKDQQANSSWDEARIRTQAILRHSLRAGLLNEADKTDFELGLAYLGVHNPLILHWTTMDELQSSGNMALIQNLDLRAHLGATRAEFDRVVSLLERQKRVTETLLRDIMSDYELIAATGSIGTPVSIVYDFEKLSADRSFLNKVSHMDALSIMTVQIQQAHIQRLERLRDALASRMQPEG
jgi:hypothetical protein